MRRLKTGRRPPIYPKTPGHLPCSSLTHPLPLPSRRPSVSFGGFGLRLPLYVRALSQLLDGGAEVVSSQQLGGLLQMTPAQIRKDLSYFGRFGKQGRGYTVRFLREELRQILGLDRK